MKRIVLHIDRLVLKGFGKDDPQRIAADLKMELVRLLTESAAAGRLASLTHGSSIRVGQEYVGRGGKPERSGISAARAIAGGLSR